MSANRQGFHLELENISYAYHDGERERPILSGLTFAAQGGSLIGLKGPSGSGKSTLLNVLGLILEPRSGRYVLNGHELQSYSESQRRAFRRKSLGYVFQHFCLLGGLTVLENVVFAGLLAGIDRVAAEEKAIRLLDAAGLAPLVARLPHQLSGGEQQRVALCRASIHEPGLILADEPTGSLDRESAEIVLAMITSAAERGSCVILASHSDSALRRCSQVFNVIDGRLQREEPLHA